MELLISGSVFNNVCGVMHNWDDWIRMESS